MHGTHCLKSWSSAQRVIAGSSGEAEYYGIVKGGSNSLGMRPLMSDLGISIRTYTYQVRRERSNRYCITTWAGGNSSLGG